MDNQPHAHCFDPYTWICTECGCSMGAVDAFDWWYSCDNYLVRDWEHITGHVETPRPTQIEKAIEARKQDQDGPFPDDSKGSNPKDIVGATKVPLDLFPDTAAIAGAMSFFEGAQKYGRYNWRAVGVRASVYVSALRRHMNQWWNGEDIDEDSGLSHLWKALACLAVLIDAETVGKLEDDRPPRAPITDLMDDMRPIIAEMKERNADKNPYQYTIHDNVEEEA